MTLATAKGTVADGLDGLNRALSDWFLLGHLDRFVDEVMRGRADQAIEVDELADFVAGAIRANLDNDIGTVLGRACRLADWDLIAGWTREALDGPDDEEEDPGRA